MTAPVPPPPATVPVPTRRAADRLAPAAIAVAPIPDTGLGEAINDRLSRAAGKVG